MNRSRSSPCWSSLKSPLFLTRQEAGTFNQEYLQLFEIEMLDLIQDEDKVEVEMIMNQFGKKIK